MPEFKDMLKYFRMKEHLSQSELAEKLGIAPSTISMYEVGKREPDFETEERIADFFNTDLNTLRGRDIEKERQLPQIINFYDQLNDFGKQEATKRVKELTYLPQYTASNEVKAARNDHINEEGELEKTLEDISNLKRPE